MGADRHRRRRRSPTFVQLFHHIVDSVAYRSASLKARAALVEVCRRYDGSNNGRIPISCRELAARLACHKETAWQALQELVELGLLKPIKKGWFSTEFQSATEWRLPFYRCNVTGALPDTFPKWLGPSSTENPPTRKSGKIQNAVRNFRRAGTENPPTKGPPNTSARYGKSAHYSEIAGTENPPTSTSAPHGGEQQRPSTSADVPPAEPLTPAQPDDPLACSTPSIKEINTVGVAQPEPVVAIPRPTMPGAMTEANTEVN
jgi:hypothetical protein